MIREKYMNDSVKNGDDSPILSWMDVADQGKKVVFRIECDGCSGTAFIINKGLSNGGGKFKYLMCTAKHVVKNSIGTDNVLVIYNTDGAIIESAKATGQDIYPFEGHDAVLFQVQFDKEMITDEDLLPTTEYESQFRRGASICWLGFPGITNFEFCCFRGTVSGYWNEPPMYLVDGVAINGVSGGPVLDSYGNILGLVTAYLPNKLSNNRILPGMSAFTPINVIRHFMEHKIAVEFLK